MDDTATCASFALRMPGRIWCFHAATSVSAEHACHASLIAAHYAAGRSKASVKCTEFARVDTREVCVREADRIDKTVKYWRGCSKT
eukprot:5646397-Prymnesium_polylepis.1